MSLKVTCPKCSARLLAPDGIARKTVRRPKCKGEVVVPSPVPAPTAAPVASPTTTAAPTSSPVDASPTPAQPAKSVAGGCCGVIVLAVAAVFLWNTFFGKSSSETTIPYEVLSKKSGRSGKFTMDVLVDQSASKEDVMKLAESLRRKYSGEFQVISIYDSREAARRRTDDSYPEKELSKHWLVVIDTLSDPGKEVRWVAKERGH